MKDLKSMIKKDVKILIIILLSLLIISIPVSLMAQGEAILEAAKVVTEKGGAITFVVVLLSALLIMAFATIVYLYKENQELHKYTKDLSEKAITAVMGMETLLDNIKDSHVNNYNKLNADHERMNEKLTEINYKVKEK